VDTIGFGDTRRGRLDGTNCADPDGIRADWYLIQAPAGLVLFNLGVMGQIDARFPLGALLSDLGSGSYVTGSFNEDPGNMFSVGDNLAAVLRVTGETPADQGTYDLVIDQLFLRE
jgi:hypothetical protein